MSRLDTRKIDAETILDSIDDGVVTIGLDKRIKYLNRAAERLLGYSLREARGMSCATIVHCAACDNDCLLDKTFSNGQQITHYETSLKNRAGKILSVSFNTALLRDKGGQVIGEVEIIRDLSRIEALTEELKGKYSFESIIGKNHRMQEIYALIPQVAETPSAVLIQGEPGTGKELLVHAIHQKSPRRDKPFVRVGCQASTQGILASELFGHVKGAFTGALANKMGRLEMADGGTLFLDEIGGLDLYTQNRLVQVLQDGWFERVGDHQKIPVDVRVMAATHRDLEAAIRQGKFRPDLYDLLRTVSIELPPLRERRDDIPLLIQHFIKRYNAEMSKKIEAVSPEAMEVLFNYDYPGNIRELENIIEHAVVLCLGNTVLPSHLPRNIFSVSEDLVELAMKREDPFKVMERQLVLKSLAQTGWNYRATADLLKVSRTTLWRKLKQLGIDRPRSKPPTLS
jgi:PAS domain S-box-containing protein